MELRQIPDVPTSIPLDEITLSQCPRNQAQANNAGSVLDPRVTSSFTPPPADWIARVHLVDAL
jgi:hypothetical protein